MINYDSILSAFDGKPTLLQWLKMVKKALDESVLKDVTIAKDGDNIAFTFNFVDGTSVTTPKVTLPKGDKGDKGEQGVSITGIEAVGDEVLGDRTLTTLRSNYSNGTSDEFVVTAKNGKDSASGNTYFHFVKIFNSSGRTLTFNFYSKKETLTFEDVINYIPSDYGIPAGYEIGNVNGVLVVKKVNENGKYALIASGTAYSNGASTGVTFAIRETDREMTDTVLGVNL